MSESRVALLVEVTLYEDAISRLVLASDPSRRVEEGEGKRGRWTDGERLALIHLFAQDPNSRLAYIDEGNTSMARSVPIGGIAGALPATNVVIELFRDLVLRVRDQTPA